MERNKVQKSKMLENVQNKTEKLHKFDERIQNMNNRKKKKNKKLHQRRVLNKSSMSTK